MASQAYWDWGNAGRPVSGLARPMAALRDRLRGQGYTVYDLGDAGHLTAQPPEDHTPFSATGWPVASARWWLHAIDVMPPSGSGLPSLGQLGQQLVLDRQSGDPQAAWIKYMNWTPDGGSCRQDSWTLDHQVGPSSDTGHIHISGRSDMDDYAGGDGYDPVARIRGPKVGDGMQVLVQGMNGGAVWIADGVHRRVIVSPRELDQVRAAAAAGLIGPLWQDGRVFNTPNPDAFGVLPATAPVVLSDGDRQALAQQVTAAVKAEVAGLRAAEAAAARAAADKLAGA